jgi:hypothetical protein
LLIDLAAHSDMASRVRPQEQMTSQRGVSAVIEGHWLDADARSLEHLVPVVLEPVGGNEPLRLPERQGAGADLAMERVLRCVLALWPRPGATGRGPGL